MALTWPATTVYHMTSLDTDMAWDSDGGRAGLWLREAGPTWRVDGTQSIAVSATQVHRYGLCPAFAEATVLPGVRRQHGRVPTEDEEFTRDLGTAAHLLVQAANAQLLRQERVDPGAVLKAHWNPSLFGRERRQIARELCDQFLWEYLHYLRTEGLQVFAAECDIWATGVLGEIGNNASPLRFTLKGRIDCLVRRGEEVVALDVKTARVLPTPAMLASDPASTVYHLLATRYLTARGKPSRLVISQLGLRRGAAVEVALSPAEVDAGKAILRSLVLALHGGGPYPPTPGTHCFFCPLCQDCPRSPHKDGIHGGALGVDGALDDIVL